jgi:hypothetical protein
MKSNNNPDWIVASLTLIVIAAFVGMGLKDYLTYLTSKQKNEIVRTAICKDWSMEQIQGLINSKK